MIHDDQSPAPDPFPFPTLHDDDERRRPLRLADGHPTPQPVEQTMDDRPDEDVLARFADVSRRIQDLARDLDHPNRPNDDNRHRPRAA
jgi:hypothetical protein